MNICENPKIEKVRAREILDSRGNWTVEVALLTQDGLFLAGVPSGASKGKHEARALEAKKAVRNVNRIIAPELIGRDPRKQKEIDDFLIKLDGTKDKSKIGANALCGVSMAVCRAGAAAKKIPLYQHINELYRKIGRGRVSVNLPKPAFNIINGGAHAKKGLDTRALAKGPKRDEVSLTIQEFMIVPREGSFSENLRTGKEIYRELKKSLFKKYGKKMIKIGDEGGFVPPFKKTDQAIEAIMEASSKIKKREKIGLALDCAASQFFKKGKYILDGKELSKKELIDFYKKLVEKYPLISLEDPFEEEDFGSWAGITRKIGKKVLIIGDDLLVTNPGLIKKAEKNKACNGMILKINQIGTITEALEAARLAKSFEWKIMVSHRSGETEDDFIADLSVGIRAEFIKSGAPFPRERMAKYNRLNKIEKELL